MQNIITYPTDRRLKNAIIKKMCKEWKIDMKSIWCNSEWNYIEYENDAVPICAINTEYKGVKYKFIFVSGCFKPYMVGTVIDYSFDINQYKHISIYKNDDINKTNPVATFAGWEVNNDTQRAYERFLKDNN